MVRSGSSDTPCMRRRSITGRACGSLCREDALVDGARGRIQLAGAAESRSRWGLPCFRRARTRLCVILAAALTAAVGAVAPAGAATVPPPSSLMLHAGDMPRFVPARGQPQVTIDANQFARSLEPSPGQARREAVTLRSLGFQEGVSELFVVPHSHDQALSVAVVLASPLAAQIQLARTVPSIFEGQFPFAVLRGFTDAAVPGSLGLAASGPVGGAVNVVFTTGRCYMLVGQAVTRGKPSARTLAGPVIAGATALYGRASGVCA